MLSESTQKRLLLLSGLEKYEKEVLKEAQGPFSRDIFDRTSTTGDLNTLGPRNIPGESHFDEYGFQQPEDPEKAYQEITREELERAINSNDLNSLIKISRSPGMTRGGLALLMGSVKDPQVMVNVAAHRNMTADLLDKLTYNGDSEVVKAILSNENTDLRTVKRVYKQFQNNPEIQNLAKQRLSTAVDKFNEFDKAVANRSVNKKFNKKLG